MDHQSPGSAASGAFRDRYLRTIMPCLPLHLIMFVEVVNMTNNTQFKTLLNTWLNQKKPMITPSTHASFTLIAENHLIPYFGKRKIGSITETDIQSYISYLYNAGRLDNTGGLTVKTIRDVILVLRLAMEFAYKERAIPLLNWDLIEYPKELGIRNKPLFSASTWT